MSPPAAGGQARRRPRTGRRAGDSGTREAILGSARQQFSEHGYEGATIRGIAAGAGVDPALVHHFYGNKEHLFAAAMRLPFIPSETIRAALADGVRPPGRSAGEHMVKSALAIWESPAVGDAFRGLLRSAMTSEHAAAMLREFITEAILTPLASVADEAGAGDVAFRAAMVGSQMLGLAITRYVLQFGPVASASHEELSAVIGPTLDRYLTGDLRLE